MKPKMKLLLIMTVGLSFTPLAMASSPKYQDREAGEMEHLADYPSVSLRCDRKYNKDSQADRRSSEQDESSGSANGAS